MAFLADPKMRALDASADALSGATLTIYNANTTTLTSVYANAALSTPLTNPVTADSSGRFPQIFAAQGTTVDLILKDSSGTTITTAEDAVFVGADTGDFERTVTGSGRIKLTGSAGAVLIQAGDPDPDNTGGTLTIEGWAGTQLATLTLDAAITDTTGLLRENGKKLNGVVYTPATTFSAASVDIALPNSPTGVRAWEIDLFDLVVSAINSFKIRFSFDNGATFKSGGSDYSYSFMEDQTATVLSSPDGAETHIPLCGGVPTTGVGWSHLRIVGPDSGSNPTMVKHDTLVFANVGTPPFYRNVGSGAALGGYGRPTHMRLYVDSGTVSGKYRVVPLRGFGD